MISHSQARRIARQYVLDDVCRRQNDRNAALLVFVLAFTTIWFAAATLLAS